MSGIARLNRGLFDDMNAFARHTGWLHGPLTAYAKYGVVLFGLLLLAGLVRSRHGTAQALAASVWAGVAILLAVAVNQPIVHAVHEARPYTGHPNVLVLVARSADPSFPSDHSVMAGAAAAGLFFVSRRLGVVTLAAAVLMALSRVYVGAHYPGDVLGGLVVGAAVAVLGWLLVGGVLTATATWLRAQPRLRNLLVVDASSRPASPQPETHVRP
ncbi:MAG: phosphatase PAP2 family protein [Jatrophihabitantaceae bacterium]